MASIVRWPHPVTIYHWAASSRTAVLRGITTAAAQQKLFERTKLGINARYREDPPEKHTLKLAIRIPGRPVHLNRATSTVKSAARSGQFEKGWSVYVSTADADSPLHGAALHLCAKAAWFDRAWSIWGKIAKDAMAYDTMIDVCARCKQFKVAEELFREMDGAGIEKSIVAYNSMMNACGMCREPQKALQYFRSIPPHLLDQASLANKQVAFQTVMISMARLGDYAQTRELFMDMTARGIPPSNSHFNALLTSCAHSCQGELAQQVFDLMPRYKVRPDVANWTILISCHRSDLTRCLEILQEMEAAGVAPSTLTNKEVLNAYILAEDGPGARAFLETKEGRIMPGHALERLRQQAHSLK